MPTSTTTELSYTVYMGQGNRKESLESEFSDRDTASTDASDATFAQRRTLMAILVVVTAMPRLMLMIMRILRKVPCLP